MKYIYQARSKEGKIETGVVEASTKEAAALLLQKYDIFVTLIKESPGQTAIFKSIPSFKKLSKKDLAIFSRQLAVMLESRVSVIQSLASLAAQTESRFFKEKIIKISQLVEEGNSLSEAFSRFPEIFSVFYISLLKTGEASGKISESLYYLSDHLEREHDISSQIKSSMVYPIFVICILLVTMGIVMVAVMPRLSELLRQTTNEAPLFTRMMLGFYDFLANYGWLVILGFLAFSGFIAYYLTTKKGRRIYDQFSLKIPFFGNFLKKVFLIRFTENVSTLITAGVTINGALRIAKNTIENFVYKNIVSDVEKGVSEGERMSSVLVKYPEYVPPFVVQLVQVGEETGKLDKNLMEIVNFYQKDVKRAVDLFTALLEPILIIFLGIIVAFLAVSVLSPLYGALGTV